MSKVLVVYYTQSGQLAQIAKQVATAFLDRDDIQVDFHEIQMVKPFPFPWTKWEFFDAFPESFQQIPAAIRPVDPEILNTQYDLVLFHYQVWYLSPSIPINSFLKSADAAKILKDVPVVTISGSRNMWIMAQEKMKVLLKDAGAKLVGNVALVDRALNLISVVTIVDWMFSGVKKRYLGFFPLPGVSDKDIQGSRKFGDIILKHFLKGDYSGLQTELVHNGAVYISSYLALVDRTGNKIFKKWSALILKKKASRLAWLKVFYVYLLLALYVISPIVYILHLILYPLKFSKIKKETLYYQGV